MTYNDLHYHIRRLQITGRGYEVPLVISMFIHEILTYSKSKDLAKRSCDSLIKGRKYDWV